MMTGRAKQRGKYRRKRSKEKKEYEQEGNAERLPELGRKRIVGGEKKNDILNS
jgi:hypothetical protein